MIERVKSWLHWVYNWITVIVASLVGLPTLVMQFLTSLEGIDFTPFMEPKTALKIVTGVALSKAVLTFCLALGYKPDK